MGYVVSYLLGVASGVSALIVFACMVVGSDYDREAEKELKD